VTSNYIRLLGARTFSKAIHGESLNTRLVGTIIEGHGFHGRWVYPWYPSDSNLSCSVLLDLLALIYEKVGRNHFPPVLFLQLDNCGRENKNHAVIGLLACLVKEKIFKQVYLNFLPVGHTHAKVDQRFSRISMLLKPKDIATMDEMKEVVQGKLGIQCSMIYACITNAHYYLYCMQICSQSQVVVLAKK
jgi:hypothetical protein